MFGAAAITEVYSDHIEAGTKTLFSRGLHVVRGSRTLNSVPGDNGRTRSWISLPTAVRQNLDAWGYFKQTLLISLGSKTKSTRPEVRRDRLRMAVAKNGVWLEGIALKRFGYVCEEGFGGCSAGGGLV